MNVDLIDTMRLWVPLTLLSGGSVERGVFSSEISSYRQALTDTLSFWRLQQWEATSDRLLAQFLVVCSDILGLQLYLHEPSRQVDQLRVLVFLLVKFLLSSRQVNHKTS